MDGCGWCVEHTGARPARVKHYKVSKKQRP